MLTIILLSIVLRFVCSMPLTAMKDSSFLCTAQITFKAGQDLTISEIQLMNKRTLLIDLDEGT